jgi:hypothetical protein
MTITALHLRADGTEELFEYDPASVFSLDLLQEKVGGLIQAAPVIDRQLTMYCNEDGKHLGLPLNERASDLLGPANPDFIVGDVVLVGAPDEDGDDTTLPASLIEAARA